VAFLMTTLIVLLIPSYYESTARLMPPDKPQLGGLASMLAAATEGEGGGNSAVNGLLADSLGVKSSGALYVGILRSDTILNQLVEKFDLRRVYHERYIVDARERLLSNTEVTEDRKSGIISITVTDHSRQRAALIAAAYVESLNELTAQLNTSAAHRQRLFIEDRLKSAKQELDAAEKDLSEFSSTNLTLDVKEQGKAMVEGAATLEEELIAAESQLSAVEQVYSINNVKARALQARIDLLKHKLAQLRGNGPLTSLANGDSDDFGISIAQLPSLGVSYYDLFRRAKIQEMVFETLTKQYELTKIQEAKELPSIKLLDKPEAPELKSGPPRTRIVLLVTILAFFASLAWVATRDVWRKTDPEDPRKAALLELVEILRRIALSGLGVIQKVFRRNPDGSPEGREGGVVG
jgi:uncharacterized protein involved in exopolysaccharide biosynthesis